ncbi:MAG TPA: Holliday junction resolvase RuvX, partial [Alphaproteobacteria bacterium]|nr:Holliday junction resolvase RuvX [Alphaproteobacteria bacterium]
MAICNPTAFKAALGPGGPLLGLDLGDRTIGIAICDPGLTVASPLETLRRAKFTEDAAKLLALVDKRRAVGLVVGLPVNMDGTKGPRVDKVRSFADALVKLRDLPITYW